MFNKSDIDLHKSRYILPGIVIAVAFLALIISVINRSQLPRRPTEVSARIENESQRVRLQQLLEGEVSKLQDLRVSVINNNVTPEEVKLQMDAIRTGMVNESVVLADDSRIFIDKEFKSLEPKITQGSHDFIKALGQLINNLSRIIKFQSVRLNRI